MNWDISGCRFRSHNLDQCGSLERKYITLIALVIRKIYKVEIFFEHWDSIHSTLSERLQEEMSPPGVSKKVETV